MQSLPLLTKRHARQPIQPTSQLRAMAAKRLGEAVRRGKVTPKQAKDAMRAGEAGVASALLPHLYQCQIDGAIPAPPIGNATHLSAENLANLSPLVKEMQAAGHIRDADLTGASQRNAGETILKLVMLGIDRVAEAATAKMPPTRNNYSPFHVSPLALAKTLCGRDGESWEITANTGKVIVSNADSPFVMFADPESRDEMSALCCVIRGINERSGNWFVVPPDDALSIIDVMLDEVLRDVRVHVPQGPVSTDMPSNVLDAVMEYYGVSEDDGEALDDAIERLNGDLRHYVVADQWKIGDGNLEKWLASPSGPNAKLILRLYDLYSGLVQGQRADEREVVDGEYFTCDLFVVPIGFWNNFNDTIQQYGAEYCPSEILSIARSARTKRPHLAALELAVMATSVATAMARIFIDESPD
ncbi:hypothetical protein XP1511_21965 [Xanthomonas perforans]|uniref:Uncharacterized protein n=2 Tax=Xanthomonas TaxID=338 RepID=A0A6V7FIU3_9XANT|nr:MULTISPECIES: hypothetical protein [Xanthomonas]KLC40576.1 hypothetical protein XP1511_21965 [Xanthomonas perforans]MBZ3284172.1 hypothetical protein [Xanthomonas perforans]NMI31431.1 hypothetical protein [Xanthomonas hortorum pv. vitians]WJM76630.1 hypothetical protein QTJ10_00325 [Xanthomonas hortorum pv. vitians]CAD0363245.1 hypothetical protein CFBP498_48420 [Xanthomonas hortorum pv. vitians]